MSVNEKVTKIEKLTSEIEGEKNFDKIVEKFSAAAELIKQALSEGAKEKGKVLEIIKELDTIIEREMKPECED